jgi:hypothetical protein
MPTIRQVPGSSSSGAETTNGNSLAFLVVKFQAFMRNLASWNKVLDFVKYLKFGMLMSMWAYMNWPAFIGCLIAINDFT